MSRPPPEHPNRQIVPIGYGERSSDEDLRTLLIVVAVVLGLLYFVQSMLIPFVIAAIIGYICSPLLDWLCARTRLPRALFASVVFLLLVAIAAAIGYIAIPRLVRETAGILTDVKGTVESAAHQLLGDQPIHLLGRSLDPPQLAQEVVDTLRNWLGQAGRLFTLAAWGVASIFGVILTMVLVFYFLVSGPRIARGLLWIVPPEHRKLVLHVWAGLDPVLKRYFIGVVIVVIYATAAAYVGLGLILGLKGAVLLAVLTGLLEIIPVIGPGASAIIAGLVALRYATSIWNVIEYAIYATVLRVSIDELLGPVVLGRAAYLHPIIVIFCFLAGVLLFGIAGVILAIPFALAIKHALAAVYEEATPYEETEETR
jgi:predicted PurR-regulated permease PerM